MNRPRMIAPQFGAVLSIQREDDKYPQGSFGPLSMISPQPGPWPAALGSYSTLTLPPSAPFLPSSHPHAPMLSPPPFFDPVMCHQSLPNCGASSPRTDGTTGTIPSVPCSSSDYQDASTLAPDQPNWSVSSATARYMRSSNISHLNLS